MVFFVFAKMVFYLEQNDINYLVTFANNGQEQRHNRSLDFFLSYFKLLLCISEIYGYTTLVQQSWKGSEGRR
jgi:uncharacterized membrane protein